jgi:hypothetical protein
MNYVRKHVTANLEKALQPSAGRESSGCGLIFCVSIRQMIRKRDCILVRHGKFAPMHQVQDPDEAIDYRRSSKGTLLAIPTGVIDNACRATFNFRPDEQLALHRIERLFQNVLEEAEASTDSTHCVINWPPRWK